MASIILGGKSPSFDKRFVALGQTAEELDSRQHIAFKKKINYQRKSNLKSNWATLGWSDDSEFKPKGKISFSRVGNLNSKALVLEEIKHIYKFNPKAKGKKFVTERYINFDDVDFGFRNRSFNIDELPELRLTLFLQPDEGAIVFYQFSDSGNYHDINADIQYILPNSTGPDHHTDRDRLHYFFPIIPAGELTASSDENQIVRSETKSDTSFVIKILTYKRNNLPAADLSQEGIQSLKKDSHGLLNLVTERYALLKFDTKINDFKLVGDGEKIDYNKKTLLLIHGTFVNTSTSFAGLYADEFKPHNTFLQSLITNGNYDQILAFDHPTIFHDAIQNCRQLYSYFGANQFRYPVDLIGTSRGALVCYTLANNPANKNFECGRIVSISGGFGVAYFSLAKHITQFLKVLRKLNPASGALISMISQFSISYFINLPGCRLLTPKSTRLRRVIDTPPLSTISVYLNIRADWDKSLIENFFKRVGLVILDAVLKLIIGQKHDMVVGFQQQGIGPVNQSEPPIAIKSAHGKAFESDYTEDDTCSIVRGFLSGQSDLT